MHKSELIEKDIHAYLKQHEGKDILSFLTCGSVDDGKSTLIGRLLHDSRMIYEDQMAAVSAASKKVGTQGNEPDLALLVDGLQAEREQGITIDVAYRYFSTERRKFIIADAPGHEQYTRNMVTGASNCDAAIILIDARPKHGMLPQTKRHSFIVSMLSIKHVVIAINKMDLVSYSRERFEEIRENYLEFAEHLGIDDLRFIPISALKGDNIVTLSDSMPWYRGGTLIHLLEDIHAGTHGHDSGFRFPVQYVNRPSSDFRGYAGTVASGEVRVGDRLVSLPSRRSSVVTGISTFDGSEDTARAFQSVTLTLSENLDTSRGDMLVSDEDIPKLQDSFDAMLVWMSDDPATAGRQYLFKINHRQVVGRITSIRHKVDIHTFEHLQTPSLGLNEIGQVNITLTHKVPMDAYRKNRSTGAFIVIDRINNQTLSAGMVLDHDTAIQDIWEAVPKSDRSTTYQSPVSPKERADLLGYSAASLLFVGLNGSGKTALAGELERRLFERRISTTLIDGQHLRLGLCRDLGFTSADRSENLRRGAEVARHITSGGGIALCCFVAPSDKDRQHFQKIVDDHPCLLIYLDAPVEVCQQRDPHKLYVAAHRGEIADFPGVSSEYEEPRTPDLRLPTDRLNIAECADRVIDLLKDRSIIPS